MDQALFSSLCKRIYVLYSFEYKLICAKAPTPCLHKYLPNHIVHNGDQSESSAVIYVCLIYLVFGKVTGSLWWAPPMPHSEMMRIPGFELLALMILVPQNRFLKRYFPLKLIIAASILILQKWRTRCNHKITPL